MRSCVLTHTLFMISHENCESAPIFFFGCQTENEITVRQKLEHWIVLMCGINFLSLESKVNAKNICY